MQRVGLYLPEGVYALKISHRTIGGVPDCYYESSAGSAWIEWKWLDRTPQRIDAVKLLSKLQANWLKRAHGNGQQTGVVVGMPDGNHIFEHNTWLTPAEPNLKPNKEVAIWISQFLE